MCLRYILAWGVCTFPPPRRASHTVSNEHMAGVFVGFTLGPRDVTCEDILYMFNIVYNVSDYYMIWSILYRRVPTGQDSIIQYKTCMV